jgi:hypothetical protein
MRRNVLESGARTEVGPGDPGAPPWLSFDEAPGDLVPDQSGMGSDAECDATVDLSQEGVKGRCATFDGNSRLVVPRGKDLDLNTVTVSAWIKPANLDGRYGIVSKRIGNSPAPYILTINGEPLCVGWEAWGGPSAKGENVGYFQGSIDEVKVWGRALTAEELGAEAGR